MGAAAQSAEAQAIAAAKNQLGVLEYCQAGGYVDGAAVERQAAMFAKLSVSADAQVVDRAYAKGRSGIVSGLGIEQPLTEAASQQGIDVATLCRQVAALAMRGR